MLGRGSQFALSIGSLAVLLVVVQSFGNEPIDTAKLPAASATAVDFVRDIQPVFQKTCYSCHGPEKQEAGLRLDSRQRAFDGGDSGKAFIPGKSSESRLIHLVAGLDEDAGLMPPEGEGTPLTTQQISLLRAWIDQGANWPESAHGSASPKDLWALQPLRPTAPPSVRDQSWIVSPMDYFILARLERERIVPSPPADRVTLMRRLYFDLLGLLPTPEEVAAYVADDRPDAYQRLVDRLFSSPHFGERWGRHWLDVARYADSDGYEKDRPRPFAWRYRQWVLEAINSDLPFDRFTVDQLAGDLIPSATLEQRVASGFQRNTLHNTEGGADPEEDRVKKTVDRTNTLGAAWLGLTVGCAQCHSHKYDPFTQREYYQLYAFFNNIEEADIDAPLPVEHSLYQVAKADFDRQHAPFIDALKKYEREQLPASQSEWEKTALSTSVIWTALSPDSANSKHGAQLEKQPDKSLLAKGSNKVSDVYVVESTPTVKTVRAIRLEVIPDDSLVQKGPGRADNGNFVLAKFTVEAVSGTGGEPVPHQLSKALADFSQQECNVEFAINHKNSDYWAVAPNFGQRHVAVFEFQEPVAIADGLKLRVTLDQKYNKKNLPHNIGRFRLSVTDAAGPISLDGLPAEVAAALAVEPSKRSAEQSKVVSDHFRTVDPQWLRLSKSAAAHLKKAPPAPETKAQAISQRSELRGTNIHVRGDFLSPGDPVEPLTPSLLPQLKPRGKTPDRLDLAQWLISETNPLPPRVTVNRVWERIFGRGIVRTIDDFGKQGETPSHPELLDWLATEFRAHDWSLKHVLRLIVTSSTYCQASTVRTELVAIDPDNTLLARQQRRRIEAEVIRDVALAASGLLDTRIGGPSVRPPQPAEYANLTYANSVKWSDSKGGDKYRRGLYTFFQRTSPYPMLMTFDSPDSNECCVQRDSSNTPLQALTLWNDPAFFECAQALGRRVIGEVPVSPNEAETNRRRAQHAFTVCLARSPSDGELKELLELYQAQRTLAQNQPELTIKLCGKGTTPAGATPDDLAAWIVVGRTLMNLDEFITRE